MTDIVPFAYEGAQLRTVILDGDPWFVAPDACRMLDLQDTTSALKMVDDDDKRCLRRSDTPQVFGEVAPQVQLLNVVNEPAMYVLILQSQKDRAKVIRRWLTHEVLPEILRVGSYGQPVQRLTPLEYARALLVAEERAEAESVARGVAEARVAELEPGAAAWAALVDADGVYAVGDVAKMLCCDTNIRIGRNRLFDYMESIGWIYRDGQRHWCACQSAVESGHLIEQPSGTHRDPRTGLEVVNHPTIRVTAKGMDALYRKLSRDGTRLGRPER